MAHVQDRWHAKRDGHTVRTARYGKGQRWQARYLAPDGRERTQRFDRKADAERWNHEHEASKDRGEWIDPSNPVTLGDFARDWIASQTWRDTTLDNNRRRLDRYILPTLGGQRLTSLRPSHIQAWQRSLTHDYGLEPSTAASTAQLLRSMLRAAVADRLINRSPAEGVKLPKVERFKLVPLERDQVDVLRNAMPDRYRAAVTLATGSGLRQGELFGLTVDRVDWLRRTIRVDRQIRSAVAGKAAHLAPPKTDASYRTIPVPDVVLRALSEHLAAYPAEPGGLIFTTTYGNPVTTQTASDVWRKATTEANLPEGANGWHALRHFYASVLIRAGESVKVVQGRLGHTSAATTLDIYSHLWPADEDRTRAAVEAALGPAPTDKGRTRDLTNVQTSS